MQLRRLSIIVLFFLVYSLCKAQNVYLVSVGVSDYPEGVKDLVLPVSDAKAVADLYKQNCSAKTVILLNRQATKKGILGAMSSLYKNASRNDIIVLFFSGHGTTEGFVAYDGVLGYDDIKQAFSSSKSKHKMIFADACYSGRLRDSNSKSYSLNSDFDVLLFLSSKHNEVSIETPEMKNGFFTSCLVRSLKGGADFNKDRVITAKELYKGVSDGVIKLSNDKQHPVMWGRFNDNMTILNWK